MADPRSAPRRWWAPTAIGAIAAAMIAVVVFSSPTSTAPENPPPGAVTTPQAPATGSEQEVQRINVERRQEGDPLAIGALDAPVGIVMYSDFQCGFCALWAEQTLPALLPYVEAGDVRIEWRDIALFGEASHQAALAAYAAGMQGEYLAFNQAVFAGGSAPSAATLSEAGLSAIAEDLGLDMEKFHADRTGADAATGVMGNIAEAQALGANATPAFLINGQPIRGAQPVEVFVSVIEGELAAQS